LAFGGVIASGKSTLADKVAFELAIPAISSDRTRKELSGVSAETTLRAPAWADAYSEEATSKVYAEVFRQARVVLSSGRSVVLDASFRTRALRAAARTLGLETGAPFTFIECRADEAVLRARLEARAKLPSVSDGRVELLDPFLAAYESADELAPSEHVVVDTAGDITQSLDLLRRAGVTGPAGKPER
jgi:predicted kinase